MYVCNWVDYLIDYQMFEGEYIFNGSTTHWP